MEKYKSESGNTLVLIVILLVISLIGLLGYVLYQNFEQNNENDSESLTVNSYVDVELTEMISDDIAKSGVSINYPKSWSLKKSISTPSDGLNTNISKISSPDDKVTVEFSAILTDGFGGFCRVTDDEPEITKLIKLGIADISYSKARFAEYIYLNIPDEKYSYFTGIQVNNDQISSIKEGDLSRNCDPFGYSHSAILIDDEDIVGPASIINLSISLNDITEDSTLIEITDAMKTDDYLIAKRIVKSLKVNI